MPRVKQLGNPLPKFWRYGSPEASNLDAASARCPPVTTEEEGRRGKKERRERRRRRKGKEVGRLEHT